MQLNHILETCLYAADLEAAKDFYTQVLGLKLHAEEPGHHVFFRCGRSMLLVFDPRETTRIHSSGPPSHGAAGAGHVAWSVTEEELGVWRQRLRDNTVAIEQEITWPHGGHSIYFRDPAGNSLELATPELWKAKSVL